ncbi:swim-type domain-containing protein [Citrus sinensis]|uniref:Swim-type domain-containing protein n=2 Tax=Citrus sinensis TaxID=2711 RepID=A0ACB8NMR8_CITSI|nr:swim-type domain-containing protein [Citrus sinensis]
MPRMEDILNLPVQDPPCVEFSAANLKWVKVEGGRQGGDDIALIPFARVEEFVKGESSNAECPASFRIESRRKRSEGSISKPRVDGYLEYTLYWCSYGPEDYRDSESGNGDGSNVKPATGKGSRPGRRHMMRGCLCHFTVKRLYTRPLLALIIYNQRKHVDKTGAPCHGILDRDAVGTRAMYAPRISEDLRQKVMSMLYVGISLDNIIQHHIEAVQGHGGPHNRDDFLTRNDVRNMERVIRNSSHELHVDDECSVKMWVQRHHKHVFFFQDYSVSEPFILVIQTDWQLQQMLHYGNNGLMSFHSTFGSKKLKYPLSTLLVFDSSHNAIPVAWIITSSFVGQFVHKWIGLLAERIRTKDPRWRLSAFLVDNPSFDISTISPNSVDTIEEFMQVFVDQCAFMDYFKSQWLPHIVTTPEPLAAIETYHLRLKSKLFHEQNVNFWPRVDWLIHTLTTEFHSLYWLDQYSMETGYFENLRDDSFSTNAWSQALHIPDVNVMLDEQNLQLAKIISQADRTLAYTIWNPGSEFSLCDCPWSRLGNVCEHVIKLAMVCKSRQVARPLLAAQVYRQALLSLLQNPPDDPLVLEYAIVHATRLQQDIKGLEELSNSGLLQPLPLEVNPHMALNHQLFPRLP